MPEFQTSPGMRDILPPESARWRRFVTVFAEVVEAAGYGQIISPLLEDLGVFQRIGDATDVVTKEMYDFVDKGGRHVALRPELTASVCRAFVQHRPPTPWKIWYAGSHFRYEKPQRGRYRQFDQVGIEVLGADDPFLDVEVIALGWEFYRALGLRQVTLCSTRSASPTTGPATSPPCASTSSRTAASLSPESQITLDKNPLRVLDSKRPVDAPIVAARPASPSSTAPTPPPTSPACRPGWRALGIPFTIETRWCAASTTTGTRRSSSRAARSTRRRTRSVAAVATTVSSRRSAARRRPASGSRSGSTARCSPATTRACSLRQPLASTCSSSTPPAVTQALLLTAELRAAGISADRAYENRSMKAQMKAADRSGAAVAVIIGSNELAAGAVTVRPLRTDDGQQTIARSTLIDYLRKART